MESLRLKDRIALITGASRGIGAAVARRFAAEGARLILLARTTGALEQIDDEIQSISGFPATLVPLDLQEFDGIDRLGALLHERFGHLDILVGNAGILGSLSPIGHTDLKTWDQVMAVNLTANLRLIRSMDPLLQNSEAGRAIFVTSAVGTQPRAFWSAYAVSKAALEMMVQIYAKENIKTAVCANLVNPGRTRTRMRAQAMPGEDPLSLKSPDEITDTFVEFAEPSNQNNGITLDCQ
ncbi:MAG: oxidoreductase [Magnetovibrio sp.]|nr:oxidoreductase [Magnetovibrio sp.]